MDRLKKQMSASELFFFSRAPAWHNLDLLRFTSENTHAASHVGVSLIFRPPLALITKHHQSGLACFQSN